MPRPIIKGRHRQMKVQITTSVSPDLKKALRKEADSRYLSLGQYLDWLYNFYLERIKNETQN